MQNLSLFQAQVSPSYDPNADIILHQGDVKDFMRTLPDGSVKLVLTSPPYNLGKDYEDRVSIGDYLKIQAETIAELVRVLREDGSICWQVGNFVDDGEVFPLDILYYDIFKKLGLSLRNRIIWYFRHGLHASKRFSGRYETILWFSKSDHYTFNLDDVRVPSKYPGKRHYKGPNKGQPSGNPKGKNPSDIWEIVVHDWEMAVWDIPNVKSNHPEKTIHPCQFPIELVERCVLALTDKGDLVFDPYSGVGSTIVGAIKHERRAMGCEKEADYNAVTRDRIEAFQNGQLRIRPLGKPVHEPTGREKVAQIPDEWEQE
jgi:adenine-specific DNA-methyltransferase